jgi:hypothetical protein
MNTPRKRLSRLRTPLVTALAYLALSAAAYLAALVMAAGSADANIGAGLVGIAPALPWVFFADDASSHVMLFVCYGINAFLAGGGALWHVSRREN